MLLTIYILLICLLIALSPRKMLWPIAFLGIVLLSSSFFFFHPTIADDLYKHYIVLDSIRSSDLGFYYLTEEFAKQSPAYFAYLHIISIFNNDAFLPVISSIIVYSLFLICLKDVFKNYDRLWTQKLCIILFIIMTRLIDISSVRNILAATLFVFGLYYDLIYHKKFSIIFYVLACLIHNLGFLYVGIRLLLFLYNKLNKFVIGVIIIAGFSLISIYYNNLSVFFLKFPILSDVFSRLGTYLNGVGLINDHIYTYIYLAIYVVTLLIAHFTEKRIDKENKFEQLYNYTILFTLFTAGSIFQRETFNRARFILIPLGILFLAIYLKNTVKERNKSSISYTGTVALTKSAAEYGISIVTIYIIVAVAYFIVLYITTYNYYSSLFVL